MFFERLGELLFGKLKPIFFFGFTALPLLFSTFYILQNRKEIHLLQKSYETNLAKAKNFLNRRLLKEEFLHRYSAAEPYFIDKKIESLHFLKPETEYLNTLKNHPAVAQKGAIFDRITQLSFEKNRIQFIEEAIRKGKFWNETDEKMRKPVEMNQEDLKNLLSIIEDVPIGIFKNEEKSPHLIITDFQMKVKDSPFNMETLEIKTNLLKREYHK